MRSRPRGGVPHPSERRNRRASGRPAPTGESAALGQRMADPRFLLMRWSRPIPDLSNPRPADAREIMGLERAIHSLIGQATTDGLGAPDEDPDRCDWWRDILTDLGVGDYFNAERDGGGHLYVRRLSDHQ